MRRFISKLWQCHIWGLHDWTSPIQERENKPDKEKIERDGVIKSFLDDSMMYWMYCRRCGHVSEVAREFRKKMDAKYFNK